MPLLIKVSAKFLNINIIHLYQGWKLTFLSTGYCGWWISKSTSHLMFLPPTFHFLQDLQYYLTSLFNLKS